MVGSTIINVERRSIDLTFHHASKTIVDEKISHNVSRRVVRPAWTARRDALLHMYMHTAHHRGQAITLFAIERRHYPPTIQLLDRYEDAKPARRTLGERTRTLLQLLPCRTYDPSRFCFGFYTG